VPDGFAVELNEKSLQQEAVLRVLDQVGVDPELTSILEAFVRANLEDEKGWDATRSLESVSEHLSKESSRPHWEALAEVPMDQLQAWAQSLRQEVAQADARIRAAATEGYRVLLACGVPLSEFSRGTLPKWFRETAFDGYDKAPSDTVLKMFSGEAAWLKDAKKSNAANEALLDDGTKEQVVRAFEQAEEAYAGSLRARFFAKNAFATGVLQALAVAYEAVCEERGVQPLSKFNSLIYKELVQQNGEYLLERLGSRFRHFFIDEAQDTSRVQWENLYPLLDHALSSQERGASGTALVVGDGKQSIYRWRNSEAEQFLEVTERAARNEPPHPPSKLAEPPGNCAVEQRLFHLGRNRLGTSPASRGLFCPGRGARSKGRSRRFCAAAARFGGLGRRAHGAHFGRFGSPTTRLRTGGLGLERLGRFGA
jgi:ATP-dependent exoDNAse (exonuclease V) beta subunit